MHRDGQRPDTGSTAPASGEDRQFCGPHTLQPQSEQGVTRDAQKLAEAVALRTETRNALARLDRLIARLRPSPIQERRDGG